MPRVQGVFPHDRLDEAIALYRASVGLTMKPLAALGKPYRVCASRLEGIVRAEIARRDAITNWGGLDVTSRNALQRAGYTAFAQIKDLPLEHLARISRLGCVEINKILQLRGEKPITQVDYARLMGKPDKVIKEWLRAAGCSAGKGR